MTPPTKPKSVHVYQSESDGKLCAQGDMLCDNPDFHYIGEYAPRGAVLSECWETRCGRWTERYDTRAEAVRSRQFEAKEHGCAPRIVHVVRRKAAK